MVDEKIILITSCMSDDDNIDFQKIELTEEEKKEIEDGELMLEEIVDEKCGLHNFDNWLELPVTKKNVKKLKELIKEMEKKLDILDNKDEVFCMIHGFLSRLSNIDVHILSDKDHKKLGKDDKIIILDKDLKNISADMSKNWSVEQK